MLQAALGLRDAGEDTEPSIGRESKAALEGRPAGSDSENGYCFIFSRNVSGLTNRTTCPGRGKAVTLPHYRSISVVENFFRAEVL
jgi:hypothetical protein